MQPIGKARKMKMIKQELDLMKLTNEELNLLMNQIDQETKRRRRIDKRNAVLEFREALGKFLDSGANHDFNTECRLCMCDLDIVWGCDVDYDEEWIEDITFNPFERDVLLSIKNELTRQIGNYEG